MVEDDAFDVVGERHAAVDLNFDVSVDVSTGASQSEGPFDCRQAITAFNPT